jgi:electron transfer flavoprotein alpha subunit
MNVLVYLEERNGSIRKTSREAVTAAQSIGASAIHCVVVSADSSILQSAQSLGAASVINITDARFKEYSSSAAAKAVAAAAVSCNADVVIIAATARGKDLAPRVAVRLDAGYVPDVTSLTNGDGVITAAHPVYAGKAMTYLQVTTPKKVFSTRPNLWKAAADSGSASTVSNLAVEFNDTDFADKTTALTLSQGKLDVAEADIIVTGGRGLKGPENWGLIEGLASALGAATGASRAVVDAGWRPHSEQVGQTGKTVSPTMYVAVAVSGAIQHLAGMSSSKTIVAINKDANAPIFAVADYGIVGDAFEILPALTDEIKKIKA